MINNIFKLLFLCLGIILTVILYDISTKLNNGRFVPTTTATIIDTRTGYKYYWEEDEGYSILTEKGEILKVKKLPK